jgi:hypothetical protein
VRIKFRYKGVEFSTDEYSSVPEGSVILEGPPQKNIPAPTPSMDDFFKIISITPMVEQIEPVKPVAPIVVKQVTPKPIEPTIVKPVEPVVVKPMELVIPVVVKTIAKEPAKDSIVIKEDELKEMTKKQLVSFAEKLGIEIKSHFKKQEIFDLIMDKA